MGKEKITENRVIVENGKIKTLFTEESQQVGVDLEEARKLLHQMLNKYIETHQK